MKTVKEVIDLLLKQPQDYYLHSDSEYLLISNPDDAYDYNEIYID